MCTVLWAVAVRAVTDDMFLTPRFVSKTIEELRGQGTDAAELARQEARLKQQVQHEMKGARRTNRIRCSTCMIAHSSAVHAECRFVSCRHALCQ